MYRPFTTQLHWIWLVMSWPFSYLFNYHDSKHDYYNTWYGISCSRDGHPTGGSDQNVCYLTQFFIFISLFHRESAILPWDLSNYSTQITALKVKMPNYVLIRFIFTEKRKINHCFVAMVLQQSVATPFGKFFFSGVGFANCVC